MTLEHVTRRGTRRPTADPDDVVAWRRQQLRAVGFEGPLATRLARTAGIDLHALLNLIDRGCLPELAVRILAPLDDTDPSA